LNDYNKTIVHNQYFDIIGHNLPTGDAENSSYSSTRQWTNTIIYDQLFADHSIKFLAGAEQIQFRGSGQGGGVNDLFSTDPNYVTLSNGNSNVSNYSFIAQPWRIVSFFGRLDYAY